MDIHSLSVCQNISKILKKNCLESYLLDEELVLEVREGGFKLGGVLLDVPTVYTVPVVLVTVDGYTVAVLFWETDLYEVEVVDEDTELEVEVDLKTE